MKTDLKWIHISDMHFGDSLSLNGKDLAECILDATRENLGNGLKPDFVAISGDITYSAEQDQYSEAARFLDRLLQMLEIERGRVTMCPGNHDIARSISHYLFQGCRIKIGSDQDIEAFLQSHERAALLDRVAGYHRFRETYQTSTSQLTPDSQGINVANHMKIDGLDVQLLEINSAWLGYGGADDYEKLVVGSLSLNHFIKSLQPCEGSISFGIIHHPFHWLASFESAHIEAICCENFDFVLHGHIHKPTTKAMVLNRGRTILLNAGAVLIERERDYHFCFDTYNITDGTLTVENHLYVAGQGRWYINTEVIDVEQPSSFSLVAMNVYEEISRRYADFIAPAHICTVICGIVIDIAFCWNGSVGFYSPVLMQQVGASNVEGAVSLLQFQRLIRFYGNNAMDRVFTEHGSLIEEYDRFLKRVSEGTTAFRASLIAREEEAKIPLETGVTDTSRTSFMRLGLRRAIAADDIAATQRYLELFKADTTSPVHEEIQIFDASIAGLSKGVLLYKAWIDSGGSDDFSFEEYRIIIINLLNKSPLELAVRAILRCAELHPSVAAEVLDEMVRNVASQYGDRTIYDRFKAITSKRLSI